MANVRGGGKGGPRKGMTDEERQEELLSMLRMRRAGASYASIASQLGISTHTAYQKIKDALDAAPVEEATMLRAIEAERLDYLERQLQPMLQEHDLKAIQQAIRLSESRRKLLGLDMPEQHEVKVSTTEQTLMKQAVVALQEQAERRAREGLPHGTDRG